MSGTLTTAPSCALIIESIARLAPASPREDVDCHSPIERRKNTAAFAPIPQVGLA
jgi:hypothetical protein